MSGRLNGKVCIVTGASSGIGQGIAELFGAEGGKVVIAARRQEKGEKVAAGIRERGGEAVFIQTDMYDEDSIRNLVAKTVETYGTIDVLIGNHGTGQAPWQFEDFDAAEHLTPLYTLHVSSNWLLTSLVLPYMLEKKNGSVVYTLSYAATHSTSATPAYGATKAALLSTVRSLAVKYGEQNIRFNGVMPGMIASELSTPDSPITEALLPFIPMGRLGTPQEIAHVYLLLATDECPFLTGAAIACDGAQTCGELTKDAIAKLAELEG